MSQDYTIFLNYPTDLMAGIAMSDIKAIAPFASYFYDQGDDDGGYWQVMYDDVLSGTTRKHQDYYDLKLKPVLRWTPLQVEFHIMTASGLQCMETITP